MKLNPSELKSGKEEDYGIWGEKERGFKLSVRWNQRDKVYECYKLFFDTHKEELMFHSEKLADIVIKTYNLANSYAKNIMNNLP